MDNKFKSFCSTPWFHVKTAKPHMQDPSADTEWNDILREKGILPPKPKDALTHEDIVSIVDQTMQDFESTKAADSDSELDSLEDNDETSRRVVEEYRRKRMQEMMQDAQRNKFGSVREIGHGEFVLEVSEASKEDGVWVVLHLFQDS